MIILKLQKAKSLLLLLLIFYSKISLPVSALIVSIFQMKLAELQKKYIVPLQKLKEKNAQKKTGEMKRIDEVLDVLMSSRKIKMENLVNIESVLFKLFTNKSSSSMESNSVDRPPMSADKAAHSAAGENSVI